MNHKRVVFILFVFFASLISIASGYGPEYANIDDLINKANSFTRNFQIDSAIIYGQKALKEYNAAGLQNDSLFGIINLKLGEFYRRKWDTITPKEYLNRASDIFKRLYGPKSDLYLDVQFEIACLYNYINNKPKSDSIYLKTLNDRIELFGTEYHPKVAQSYLGLALIRRNQMNINDAFIYTQKAVEIYDSLYGINSYKTATAMSDLALIKYRLADFKESGKFYHKCFDAYANMNPPDSIRMAMMIYNLGQLKIEEGDYAGAEDNIRLSIKIKEKLLGPRNSYVASSLRGLGELFYELRKDEQAERYFKQALAIYADTSCDEHFSAISGIYNTLGLMYQRQGKFWLAQLNIYKAIDLVQNKQVWTLDYDYIDKYINLATLYLEEGDLLKADLLAEKALACCQRTFKGSHPYFGDIYMILARIYIDNHLYNQAETFIDRAMKDRINTYGDTHDLIAECLKYKSRIERLRNNHAKAIDLIDRACKIYYRNFSQTARYVSEHDALKLADRLHENIDEYISTYIDATDNDSNSINRLADILFSFKGTVSDEIITRQQALVLEEDEDVIRLTNDLNYAKYDYSKLFFEKPLDTSEIDNYYRKFSDLNKRINELEDSLSRKSRSFSNQVETRSITTDRVRRQIPENALLIEFVKFDYIDSSFNIAQPYYLAVLIDSKKELDIKLLGPADDIDRSISLYRSHMFNSSKYGQKVGTKAKRVYMKLAGNLKSKIWSPLEDIAKSYKMLFFAPDGEINSVSFAGLPLENGRYLIEDYTIHYLSSGRDLIRLSHKPPSGSGLLAIGDPNFNIGLHKNNEHRINNNPVNTSLLTPLPNSRAEIKSIIDYWQANSSEPVYVFLGNEANEKNFKAESKGKRVIHIATHGYFLKSQAADNSASRGGRISRSGVIDNPLLNSGLFLAGASNTDFQYETGQDNEDGILTAYEVSTLNLQGLDLVVLSACESAQGEVKIGEGVYGLRRAFQIAGASTIISSLWPISDKISADMLKHLYIHKSGNTAELVRQMELNQLNHLRKEGLNDHPVIWSAFISIGDWR